MSKPENRINFITSNRLKNQNNLSFDGKNLYYSVLGGTVNDFSIATKISITKIIADYFAKGIIISSNYELSEEEFLEICDKYSINLIENPGVTPLNIYKKFYLDIPKQYLRKRPPIVTIMGHVDHGKTTLLDTIRKSNIVKKEHGQITQHINAYKCNYKNNSITFIDTPGHEAFSKMRARGSQITDIVLLIISATEGLKKQTIESIEHIKKNNVNFIVVFNKIDLDNANIEKCINQLSTHNILLNGHGGNIDYVEISAKNNKNIELLLQKIIHLADSLNIQTADNYYGYGVLVEKGYDNYLGNQITILNKFGVLKPKDLIIIGNEYFKIKFMHDENNKIINIAKASDVVKLYSTPPNVFLGDMFIGLSDLKVAKIISDTRKENTKLLSDELLNKRTAAFQTQKIKVINILLSTDTMGSLEAIISSIKLLQTKNLKINIIKAVSTGLTSLIIKLAHSSHAKIYCFNSNQTIQIKNEAKELGVEILNFNIIYKLLEHIEETIINEADDISNYKYIGRAKIIKVFDIPGIGIIAGCKVIDGFIKNKSFIKITRNGKKVCVEQITSLKHRTENVDIAKRGIQCGIKLNNFKNYKINDEIKAFIDEV